MVGVSPPPRWGWAVVGGAFLQAGLVFGGLRALGLCLGALGGSFGAQAGAVAWVGSAAIASLQLGGPLGSALSTRYGARPVVMAGGFLAGMGFLLGAFATRLSHLYLSVGLLAGLGWALVFTPSLGAVSRYFPTRRAMATGLAMAGASVVGLALGPLIPLLLDAYGWRGSLLLLAALSFNLMVAGALLRPLDVPTESPRPPPARGQGGLRGLLHHGPFLRYALAFVLVDAGYYVPHVHGPARAQEVGCDEQRAGLVMAVTAVADGIGRVVAGLLAAHPTASLLRHLFAWSVLTGLALLLFPLGTSFGGLTAVGLGYGFCAGAIVPLQFTGVAEVVGAGRLLHAIGLMQMFESIGSLLGAPFAGWLRDLTGDFKVSFLSAGAFLLAGSLLILTLPSFFRTSRSDGSGTEGVPDPVPKGLELPSAPLSPPN
ncbi:monocarboxylate transporter 13 isoform X1 [Gallus gallus]|uniref:monocarboxylate transporter 13 isoform X1 n=1 Tax=Gallus gallus TaxID=9031 RepID=UPI001AE84C02|nr:monocarboxylate transporter 13 isoform X1 [Gallus gallus]